MRQLAQIAEELDKLGVVLKSATEPFGAGQPAGGTKSQMPAAFAEFEHATIVDQITAGIERRTRQGYWPNGRVLFGYIRNDAEQLVADERAAPTVKRSFRPYTSGRLGAASIRGACIDTSTTPAFARTSPQHVAQMRRHPRY